MATERKDLEDITEEAVAQKKKEQEDHEEFIKTIVFFLECGDTKETLKAQKYKDEDIDLALKLFASNSDKNATAATSPKSEPATENKRAIDERKAASQAVESKETAETASSGWSIISWLWSSKPKAPSVPAQPIASSSTAVQSSLMDDAEVLVHGEILSSLKQQKFEQYFSSCRVICKALADKSYTSATNLKVLNVDLSDAYSMSELKLNTAKLFDRVIRTTTGTKEVQLTSLIANVAEMRRFFGSEQAQTMDAKSFAERMLQAFASNAENTVDLIIELNKKDKGIILLMSEQEAQFELFLRAILQVKKPCPTVTEIQPWMDAMQDIAKSKQQQAPGKP